MNAAKTIQFPERLRVLVTLAQLLQRLEGSPGAVAADQYRSVARHLVQELAATPRDDALDAALRMFPATAELYENLHYAQAGLCRQPLDLSLRSEVAASTALQHAARRPA